MTINFDVSPEDFAAIDRIADRIMAHREARKRGKLEWTMDLTATHNALPLDLAKLEAFNDFNFYHDVFGIARHLNRETAELENFFRPRCTLATPHPFDPG